MSQQNDELRAIAKQLENTLADESKRRTVEEILDNFCNFERSVLIDKVSIIVRYLSEIAGGSVGANLLMDIVSKAPPEVDNTLALFESSPVRDWARFLNRKYVAVYEGTFPPFKDDWYRIFWSTSLNTTFNMPFIGIRLVKRNGEVVHIDQPFAAALTLITHQLRQMKKFKDQTKAPLGKDFQKELKEIQDVTNSLLTDAAPDTLQAEVAP